MKIQTKYNFGDKPWKTDTEPKKTWEICSFCNVSGEIVGQDGSSQACPKCYGHKGKWIFKNTGCRVLGQLTISEVSVGIRAKDSVGLPGHEHFSNFGPQEAKHKEVYMCKETGIGSGTLHDVSTLWPTKEEAETECKRRNEEEKNAPDNIQKR